MSTPDVPLPTGQIPLVPGAAAASAGVHVDAEWPTLALGDALRAACAELEHALRDPLCVTSVVIRLHTRGRDLEYRSPDAPPPSEPAQGAKLSLLINDALGIVGDIDVIDGCHTRWSGRAIQQVAKIVRTHADPLRRCLARESAEEQD